jgi:hypothetical protein
VLGVIIAKHSQKAGQKTEDIRFKEVVEFIG